MDLPTHKTTLALLLALCASTRGYSLANIPSLVQLDGERKDNSFPVMFLFSTVVSRDSDNPEHKVSAVLLCVSHSLYKQVCQGSPSHL